MSTIQNLNNGETGLSHRNKLNTNFYNLNTDKVETSVTVNGHELSSNVTLTTDDVAEGATNKYDEVVALLAGAGIQVTGTYPNFTVTNTSPDQVVSLTAGTNVTITGTYPNFTIAATGGSGSGDMDKATYDPANIAQQVVGTTATQTLTNKTTTSLLLNLASPKYNTTTSIDSGGATTVLTSASNGQIANGSTGANIAQLPVASTMQIGQYFIIRNDGANTNPLTINSSGGNLVYSLPSGENIRVVLIKNTGTDASSWRVEEKFATDAQLATKQDTLVSGTNIKTINGDSILGSGNLDVAAGSGGYAANVYFTNTASTTVGTYNELNYIPEVSATTLTAVAKSNEVLLKTFLYDGDISTTLIDSGLWSFHSHCYTSSTSFLSNLRFEVFKRASGGTETTLFSVTSHNINSTTEIELITSSTQSSFSCSLTDRLCVRVYASTTRSTNTTISFVVGNENASYFNTPLALRHNQLRARDAADSHPASAITNTPAGTIAATTVQAAINELDTEKVPTSRTLTINGTAYDLSADRSWTVSGGKADIIDFSQSGTVVTGTVATVIPTSAGTLNIFTISLASMPVGANFLVDLKKNGTSVLSAAQSITTTESATNGFYTVSTGDSTKSTISTTAFSAKDVFTVVITQVGSTFAGANFSCKLTATYS